MKTFDFEECCGINYLCDFPGVGEEITEDSRQSLKNYLVISMNENGENEGIGILLAVLNTYQEHGIGDIFKNAGFRIIDKSINHNSGSMLYVYSFHMDKPDWEDWDDDERGERDI